MDVAIRSYLTAGVAVVGATAITLAPIEVLPPDIQLRGDQLVAVLQDVSVGSLADLVTAAQRAWSPVGAGVEAGAAATGTAIRDVGVAISETVAAGVAGGGTAFTAIVNALLAQGSSLAVAVDAAIAAFPTPQAFIDAFVSAIATVDINLSLALDVALEAIVDLGLAVDAAAIADALLSAGPELLAAFNAAVAAFPSPAEFSAALATALGGVFPGLSELVTDGGVALANLITTLATTLAAGIDLGGSAFDVLLAALQNGGSELAEAFGAAIASFSNPQAFIDAFIGVIANVSAPLAGALEVAFDLALTLGIDLDVAAIVQALIETGGDLAVVLELVLAGFPNPVELIAAFGGALAGLLPGFEDLTSFAAAAVANLSAALASAIEAGFGFGGTAFQALIDGLQDAGSALYAAFAAAIAAFPTPQLFIEAFVDAFAAIDVSLGAALEVALDAFITGLEIINPGAIATALINAGGELVGLFESVIDDFPTPAELVAVLSSALGAVLPGIDDLAAAGVAAISNFSAALVSAIEAGIALGGTGFEAIIDGLLYAGSELSAALAAAIAAFPTPALFIEAFVDAFVAIDVSLGAAFELALQGLITGLEIINPAAIATALIEAGGDLAAIFGAVLDDFPTPVELVNAFSAALTGLVPGVAALADAAALAISNLSAELAGVIEAGFGFGGVAFEAIVGGIESISGDLGAAFQAVLDLFPNPELFVQALENAFGEIGPVLAQLGTALAAGLEGSLELGGAAFEALTEISANIGATISASLSASLEGLPTPDDIAGAVGTIGESVVEATGYLGDTVATAVNQFTTVATAVAVAFRDSTNAALANGQNAFEALATGIASAAAQIAAGFSFGVDVDVDVDVEGSVGGSSADVASAAVGTGQLFSVATAPAAESKAATAPAVEEKLPAPVVEEELPAAPVVEEESTTEAEVVNPVDALGRQIHGGLDHTREQIQGGLDNTRKQLEGGLNGARENIERALGIRKPAASESGSKADDSAKDNADDKDSADDKKSTSGSSSGSSDKKDSDSGSGSGSSDKSSSDE